MQLMPATACNPIMKCSQRHCQMFDITNGYFCSNGDCLEHNPTESVKCDSVCGVGHCPTQALHAVEGPVGAVLLSVNEVVIRASKRAPKTARAKYTRICKQKPIDTASMQNKSISPYSNTCTHSHV